jgi:uncharacterized membrane protein
VLVLVYFYFYNVIAIQIKARKKKSMNEKKENKQGRSKEDALSAACREVACLFLIFYFGAFAQAFIYIR